MHVLDMIFFWADAEPGRPAVILPDMVLTYRALADAIESVAEHLEEQNLSKQESIAVSLTGEAKLLATCLSAMRAGFHVAPVSPASFPQLVDAGITAVITQNETVPGLRNIQFDDGWLPSAKRSRSARPTPASAKSYGSLIFFTSGTTGAPKKIVEKAEAAIARSQLSVFFETGNNSRILVLPGLTSHFGFNLACDILRVGKTVCFCPVSERALWMIAAFGIDFIHASPHQALVLCQIKEKHPEYPLNTVQAIRIGGALPAKQLVRRIQSRICTEVLVIYASTEGSHAATASYAAIEHVPDAVGFVMPWTELEIVDEHDNKLPAGTEGRVRYRNPYFLANLSAEQSLAPADARARWFYPGDIGSVTAEGILCIKGRLDDVVNRGGVKVSAVAVEERLLACPGVKDAAVCGAAGLSEITQLWVAVVPEANFNLTELRHFIETDAALDRFIGTDIDQIFVVETIPRGELGKIKRQELKEMLLAMLKQTAQVAR
jgi:acyl-coenzyme A synthetase/AMP-(fatty) acid ligase